MVSVILPASMTTTMPRATPMISATPSRSRAPLTKVSMKVSSSSRVSGANLPSEPDQDRHAEEQRRHLRPSTSPELITPQSIIAKVIPKSARMMLRTRVNSGSGAPAPAPFRKCAMFSSRWSATTECAGSAFTREA